MTEEWLKCQTQKMIVELNRYIWLSDNDIHKKPMYVSFNEQVMKFLYNFSIQMSMICIITFNYHTFAYSNNPHYIILGHILSRFKVIIKLQ